MRETHPIEKAGFLRKFFFSWLSPIINRSSKVTWDQNMHPRLPKRDRVAQNYPKLKEAFSEHKGIIGALLKLYPTEIIVVSLIGIVFSLAAYGAAFITKELIRFINDKDDIRQKHNLQHLIVILSSMALIIPTLSLIGNYINFRISRIGISFRAAVYQMLQIKILKFSSLNSKRYTKGFIMNLLQVDTTDISKIFTQLLSFIQKISSFLFGFYFIWITPDNQRGVFFLCVVVTSLILTSISLLIAVSKGVLNRKILQAKDRRMGLFKNILTNLSFIKSNGLENRFCLKVFDYRKEEIKYMKYYSFLEAITTGMMWTGVALVPFVVMVAIQKYDIKMSPESFVAFLQIFQTWSRNLISIIADVSFFIKLSVSVKRINQFLGGKEKDHSLLNHITFNDSNDYSVSVSNGNFRWKYSTKEEYSDPSTVHQGNRNSESVDTSYLSLLEDTIETQRQSTPSTRSTRFQLKNINLKIRSRKKVAILGNNNSGKSSLLYLLLGEMIPSKECDQNQIQLTLRGKIGFLSQDRWMIGDTIQENITMGKPFDPELMNTVLEASQLLRDMSSFENGLNTMMGDSEDTVSGGQKARIALARCFYQEPDVLLLDDPTSSLDNNTASNIMETLTHQEPWKSKTILVASNNLKTVEYVDQVIFLDNGMIEFQGTSQEFKCSPLFKKQSAKNQVDASRSEDKDMLQIGNTSSDYLQAKPQLGVEITDNQFAETQSNEDSGLDFFLKEDKLSGNVSLKVFWRTLKGIGGWRLLVPLVIVAFEGLIISFLINSQIQKFGVEYYKKKIKDPKIVGQAFWFIWGLLLLGFLNTFLIYYPCCWLSSRLHSKMIFHLLHAKITEFFDRIPMGTLLNRFSADIDQIDTLFASTFNFLLLTSFMVLLGSIGIFIGIKQVWIFIPCILFIYISFRLRKKYMTPNREMVRLLAITKSPIVGIGTASTEGGAIIRSLSREGYFEKKMEENINENTKNALISQGLNNWFIVNSTLFDVVLVLIPAYLMLAYTLYVNYGSKEVDSAAIAFFLNQVVGYASSILGFILVNSSLENLLVSAERCKTYEEIQPEEGYKSFIEDSELFQNPAKTMKKALLSISQEDEAQPSLVQRGGIQFLNVSAKYPGCENPVLKNLNLSIQGGQKVGIVGRSGAGKSSFIKLIWRALTPFEGNILVDGQNVTEHDLKAFRKQLTIISQKPNLFEGTLLSNIARGEISNSQRSDISKQLLNLGFSKSKLSRNGLGYLVEADGSNLSQSEKQIVGMVRALNQPNKIVILDEATAFVDSETEQKFQERIHEEFKESTLFIIAHRISTILQCDRILVFEEGSIVQDGTVAQLLQDKHGIFFDIWSKI